MKHASVGMRKSAHDDPSSNSISRPLFTGFSPIRSATAISSSPIVALAYGPSPPAMARDIITLPDCLPLGDRSDGWIQSVKRPIGIGRHTDLWADGKTPRLLSSVGADRTMNVIPSHALVAGGRPIVMKIPGR